MKTRSFSAVCCMALVMLACPAFGAFSVLSGQLRSTDPHHSSLPTGCYSGSAPVNYSTIELLMVTSTGTYSFASLYAGIGIDVYFAFYDGPFHLDNPALNRIAHQDIDDWSLAEAPLEVNLQQGVEYLLVVSPWCDIETGNWTLAASGPGAVESVATRHGLDEFTRGTFTGAEPKAQTSCPGREYHQSGPQRVSRTGRYWLIDASYYFQQSVCVHVYTAPFDAADPSANWLATLDGLPVTVDLDTRQDYYFVVQPRTLGDSGEYLFVIAPPGGATLDTGFTGSWYNPATPGQGFFIEVLEPIGQVFLGWFTFDLERPATSQTALLGDPGHRWLTAFGPIDEQRATLDIEVTSGGVFDEANPRPQQLIRGQIGLEMIDCDSGVIQFDLGIGGHVGQIPIQRLGPVNTQNCDTFADQAGPPRRLAVD